MRSSPREGHLTARKPTIDDVAALSGVGRTTVSRVLNDGPNVSDKVRRRVQEAVRSLGYTVNVQARTLAGGHGRTVMLICASTVDSEPNSYYQSALEIGALRACARSGLQLITQAVVQDAPDHTGHILELIRDSRANGAILTPPFSDDVDLARAILARRCAIVCVSPGPRARALVPSVGIDDEVAAFELACYLLSLGHRHLGFIQGLEGHLSAEQRYRGVVRALAGYGLGEGDLVTRRGDFTFRSGKDLLPAMVAATPNPTAIFCANDDMAAGALFAAHQLDITVPQQLSIAGFDDTPVSGIVWPPLTTVHQPLQDMSQRAVEILAEMLRAPDAPPCAPETIAHAIVARSSTAPPAPRRR